MVTLAVCAHTIFGIFRHRRKPSPRTEAYKYDDEDHEMVDCCVLSGFCCVGYHVKKGKRLHLLESWTFIRY